MVLRIIIGFKVFLLIIVIEVVIVIRLSSMVLESLISAPVSISPSTSAMASILMVKRLLSFGLSVPSFPSGSLTEMVIKLTCCWMSSSASSLDLVVARWVHVG